MNGEHPARVADAVINEIRSRERGGLVELPKPPKPAGFRPGERVRVTHGPLSGCLGLCQGMRAGERVEVLLALLGRVTLPKGQVEALTPGG
jgi:transcription antitermination factor NusG